MSCCEIANCIGKDHSDVNDDDDDDYDGDDMESSGMLFSEEAVDRKMNIRLVPLYDENGGFYEEESTVHLCRYLFPWPAARFCTYNLGLLDCGIRVTLPRLLARICGRGRGRRKTGSCSCWMFFLILALFATMYIAWTARSDLHAVVKSPCYVCDHKKADFRHMSIGKDDRQKKKRGVPELTRYGLYIHGVSCALDESEVKALDEERTRSLLCETRFETTSETTKTTPSSANDTEEDHHVNDRGRKSQKPHSIHSSLTDCSKRIDPGVIPPWTRYVRYIGVGLPEDLPGKNFIGGKLKKREEDWRNAIPTLWVVGFRGSGTTSLGRYLDFHPDVEVRRRQNEAGGVPWDDHFFAEIPYWDPPEIRAWMQRGWGEPTMADHQGVGKTRVELGPDYLWRTSSGAAGAVRRAVGHAPENARFLIVLADPVRLAREAHQRAVDSGVEPRTSFGQIVADELPRLAQCLWFGHGESEEQDQRMIEGLCGGGEPGRIGAPYLWRGLQAPFVHHWMRVATPGRYGQWYAIRSEDLMHNPNATLNRVLSHFVGLRKQDFGPVIERIWHPSTEVATALAPKATWVHSWNAHLPRTEYLNQVRKKTADHLLDSAQRAAKRWVPGLEASFKTAERLRRLHCRLSGFMDPDIVATQQCLSSSSSKSVVSRRGDSKDGKSTHKHHDRAKEEAMAELEREREEEERAIDALRDFYALDQERLMYLLDVMDRDRLSQQLRAHGSNAYSAGNEGIHNGRRENDGDNDADGIQSGTDPERFEEELRKFYLKQ